MFLGYGSLHETEIWNNQRTLDYLAGDPDKGIRGMASGYSFVNRKSDCGNLKELVCDPPVDLAEFRMSYSVERLSPTSLQTSYSTARLNGVTSTELFFLDSAIGTYLYTDADSGQPRPDLPPLTDPNWTTDSFVSSVPLPFAPVVSDTAPLFSMARVYVAGMSGFVTIYSYYDPQGDDDSVNGFSSDGGETWSSFGVFSFMVDVGLGDGSRYSTPAQDQAPWYDANIPESADFAGLYVEEVIGFDAPVSRELTDSAIIGGSLGPLNLNSRSVTVTGWLRSATCCAADYGLNWLTEALIGQSACDDDCSMGDLVMFRCCPPASDVDPDRLNYARTVPRVGLIDGPKVVDRTGVCCGNCGATSLKVQFTIASESPYIFSDVDWLLYQQTFNMGPYDYDLTLACAKSTNCPPPPPMWEPACGPTYPPPPSPFVVDDDCYCEPWTTMRTGVTFHNTHQWNDVSSFIEIRAGQSSLRNLKISAFQNPRNMPLPYQFEIEDEWMCTTPCATIAVSEIPSGSRLVIDSRVRTVELILAGGQRVPGLRYVSSGDEAAPFDFFDVGPCTRLSMVASVEAQVSPDATISVGLVNRYLASGG